MLWMAPYREANPETIEQITWTVSFFTYFRAKHCLQQGHMALQGLPRGRQWQSPPANAGDGGRAREGPPKEGTAAHSSVLAWRIPWTEEPGGLQPTGPRRVGHD